MFDIIFKKIDAWAVRSVSSPGDDKETLLRKKIWWGLALFWILCSVLDMSNGISSGQKNIAFINAIDLTICSVLLIVFFFHREKIETYGLILQLAIVVFPSLKVFVLGGVFNATGIALIGLIGPVYALTFPNYKRAVLIFLFYLSLVTGITLFKHYQLNPEFFLSDNIIYRLSRFSAGLSVIFFISMIYSLQIAKLKRIEEERLVKLHHTKSKLYSNITHEFRTPLTVILGMAEKIEEDPKNMLQKGVKLIRGNGFKLLKLVNQLLTMSRMEADSLTPKMVQSDIIPFIKYTIESFHTIAEEKDIRLHFLTELSTLRMDFDSKIIEDILSNLLSNAIKFTPEGGDVYVQLSRSGAITADKSELLTIRVRDTGKGIAENKLPHIFNRFYQADDESTRKAEGTGIGLALVKEYIQILKGSVDVKSEPARGTEFIIQLPVSNEAPKQTPDYQDTVKKEYYKPEKEIPEVQSPTEHSGHISDDMPLILLVEDNPDVVEYLRSVLDNHYQIDIASDGIIGIEKAMQAIPDLIVCDIMMPEKNGYEVCKTLKTDFRTNHIPIIMLTAKADIDSKINGFEYGADAYMIKPFNKKELLVRINNLIDNRQTLKEKYSDVVYSSFKDTQPEGLNEVFLQKLLENLELNYQDERYTIDQLCIDTAVSRAQLHRKLIAITGKSTSDFIRNFRINKAKELLLNPDITIS